MVSACTLAPMSAPSTTTPEDASNEIFPSETGKPEDLPPNDPTANQDRQPPNTFPNLELYATYVERLDIGSGLQRFLVLLDAKNASTGWFSYRIGGAGSQSMCLWNVGQTGPLGSNPEGDGAPVLWTKQGYQYPALTHSSLDFTCGAKSVGVVPPGTYISWVVNPQAWPDPILGDIYGMMAFEIPEGATPDIIHVPYRCGSIPNLDICSEPHTTTLRLENSNRGQIPFDLTYSPNILNSGEVLDVGESATLSIDGARLSDGSAVGIQVAIESLHPGYSHKVSMLIGLISNLGEVLEVSPEWNPGIDRVGPMQSIRATAIIPLEGSSAHETERSYWVFGQITLEEDSTSSIVTSQKFIVSLDDDT